MAPKKVLVSESSSSLGKTSQNISSKYSGSKLVQNSREFIGENLEGALVDWLKEQPLFKDASGQDRGVQEKVIKELANNLISVIERTPSGGNNDTDAILLEEIKTHVEKLPMNAKLKSNQSFVDDLPTQILSHLKSLKLFQDINEREDETSIDLNVSKWVDDMPLSMMSSGEKLSLKNLKDQFVEKIKQSDLEYESALRDETKRFLENVALDVDDDQQKEKLLYDLEETLVETIAKKPKKLRLQQLSNKFIVEAVAQWAKTLVLQESENDIIKDSLSAAKSDLVTTLSNKFVYAEEVPLKIFCEVFQDATKDFLDKIPEHQYKADSDVDILVKSLQDTFKEYSKKYPMIPDIKPAKKKAAVALLEDVSKWVKRLPIEASTPEEQTEVDKMKLQLESKLFNKIGEMNMNIEIFNDDFIYEDILEEEIDSLLENLQSEAVQDNKDQLKRSLMDIILKARQSMQDENVNQVYKQQLHETILKIIPNSEWTEEGRASLEVMKDEVADAFINMRYLGDNLDEIYRFKKQISDTIHQFCRDYLKRCPAAPLDTKMISQKLFNALNKIPEPENESFRTEVEIIKLKDEINKWAKELPLKDQDAHDRLQRNKIISTLAKKLHDIESSKELVSAQDLDEKIRKEIKKFLIKQPLKTGNEEEINELVEKLAKALSDTEESRKLNATMKSSFTCPGRRPQIRISFHDASISPKPTNRGEYIDCSHGVCLDPIRCSSDRDSSAQTTCAPMRAIGSQMSFHEDDEACWETVERICRQMPKTSVPTEARQPSSRKCPQTPECLIPRQDSDCTKAALKSCLVTKPFPPQPANKPVIRQHDMSRSPCLPNDYDECDDFDFQSPFQAAASGPEVYEPQRTPSKMQCGSGPCSTSTPYPSLKSNSGCQRSISASSQHAANSNPNYPFHLSTQPKPGTLRDQADNTCRPQVDSIQTETPCHPPGPPCPLLYLPGQRNVLESQCIPCQRPGTMQLVSEPSPSCLLYPPPQRQIQGQPWMSPRSSVTYSPSQQVPCPIRPPRPYTPEEYGARPGYPVGFQRPMARPGSMDHMDPRVSMARQRSWGPRTRNEERPWESDKEYFNPDEDCTQRDGKKCKCQHRLGEYTPKRFSQLFHFWHPPRWIS